MSDDSPRYLLVVNEVFINIREHIAALNEDQREEMLEAGLQVLECHRVLSRTKDTIVGELIKNHDTFYAWDHYPPGDVYDKDNYSQFYYHSHRVDDNAPEHGHFHTFLHKNRMGEGAVPLDLPTKKKKGKSTSLTHLVAISMDRFGIPTRLFTTNRWVTGEVWYPAEDLLRHLHHFNIDLAHPSWAVNLWITNMLILFRPQIHYLIQERDLVIERWKAESGDPMIYLNRDYEIPTSLDISVDNQMQILLDLAP